MKRKFYMTMLALIMILSCTMICFATDGQTSQNEGSVPLTLEIHKIDAGTELPVAGAEFVLSKEDGYFLGGYLSDTALLWTDDESNATVLVADRDGIIVVKGLLPGTYYLKEINAPEGYLLLEEAIRIDITAEYVTDGGVTSFAKLTARINDGDEIQSDDPQQGRIVIPIENTYDTILPETGGIGPLIYYMFGFVILFAGSLIFAAKRLIREQ